MIAQGRPIAAIALSWALVLGAALLPRVASGVDNLALGLWIAGIALQAVIAFNHFFPGGISTGGTGTPA